jgi:hypothetical protein
MFGIDVITSYLLVIALATLLLAVLVWQTHRSGRTVIVWLASSVLGLVLGSIGSYAIMCTLGYQVSPAPPPVASPAPSGGPMGSGMGKMGMGGSMGMGKSDMGGGMGMGMSGMGGMGAPQSKRDLTTLVRKIDLLTGDIAITLTSQQAAAISECLKDVEKSAKMSDDEAKAKHDKLLAIFTDAQKDRFNGIGLPRPAAPSDGGGGGMMGMGGMMGKGGDPKQDQDQNPFQQEPTDKALKSLRDRLTAKGGAEKPKPDAAAPKPAADSPKAGAEKPKPSEPPKPAADKGSAKK